MSLMLEQQTRLQSKQIDKRTRVQCLISIVSMSLRAKFAVVIFYYAMLKIT